MKKNDCSIDSDNTDITRLNEEREISKDGGNIDNYPFMKNLEQTDQNSYEEKCIDTDNDWICDDNDSCVNLPENYNWNEDKDWCPEIPDISTPVENISIKVSNCNTCPCHFANYAWPFIPWTIIKALLVDPSNTNKIYNVSAWIQY